jgi:hypothetical protein
LLGQGQRGVKRNCQTLFLTFEFLLLKFCHFLLKRDQDRQRIHFIGFDPDPTQAIVLIDLVKEVFLVKGCVACLTATDPYGALLKVRACAVRESKLSFGLRCAACAQPRHLLRDNCKSYTRYFADSL